MASFPAPVPARRFLSMSPPPSDSSWRSSTSPAFSKSEMDSVWVPKPRYVSQRPRARSCCCWYEGERRFLSPPPSPRTSSRASSYTGSPGVSFARLCTPPRRSCSLSLPGSGSGMPPLPTRRLSSPQECLPDTLGCTCQPPCAVAPQGPQRYPSPGSPQQLGTSNPPRWPVVPQLASSPPLLRLIFDGPTPAPPRLTFLCAPTSPLVATGQREPTCQPRPLHELSAVRLGQSPPTQPHTQQGLPSSSVKEPNVSKQQPTRPQGPSGSMQLGYSLPPIAPTIYSPAPAPFFPLFSFPQIIPSPQPGPSFSPEPPLGPVIPPGDQVPSSFTPPPRSRVPSRARSSQRVLLQPRQPSPKFTSAIPPLDLPTHPSSTQPRPPRSVPATRLGPMPNASAIHLGPTQLGLTYLGAPQFGPTQLGPIHFGPTCSWIAYDPLAVPCQIRTGAAGCLPRPARHVAPHTTPYLPCSPMFGSGRDPSQGMITSAEMFPQPLLDAYLSSPESSSPVESSSPPESASREDRSIAPELDPQVECEKEIV